MNTYLEALRGVVGEEQFPFALEHMRIAGRAITPARIRELKDAKDNKERVSLMEEWCGNFLNKEVKNAIALMAENNQLEVLKEISDEKKQLDESVVVTTAKKLNEEEKEWLERELRSISQVAQINYLEDSSIIGGIKIRIGDREVDNSIKTKLQKCFI
jgi:F-type H+-transporting ATPase subunit delta